MTGEDKAAERIERVFRIVGATVLNQPVYVGLQGAPAFRELLGRGYTDLTYREGTPVPDGITVTVTFVRKVP